MVKLLQRIMETEGKCVKTRISGYWYHITYNEFTDTFEAEPFGRGSTVYSSTDPLDYAYTHAGKIAKQAIDLLWEIDKEYREFNSPDNKNYRKISFIDATGKANEYNVKLTMFGDTEVNNAYHCPLCYRIHFLKDGCSSGHIAISPEEK